MKIRKSAELLFEYLDNGQYVVTLVIRGVEQQSVVAHIHDKSSDSFLGSPAKRLLEALHNGAFNT